MDTKQELELIELARRIKELDSMARKQKSEKGEVDSSTREEFNLLAEKIRNLLFELGPIDKITNFEVRDVLRKIRDRNFFLIDIEKVRLERLLNEHPEVIENILKDHGIEVTEQEIDEELDRYYGKFCEQITELIEYTEYFDRKEKFTTIIVNERLPKKIHTYFSHVKHCFLLGQMFATLGLSRVLLEVALKDTYNRLQLSKIRDNIYKFNNKKSIGEICQEICLKLKSDMRGELKELYDISSNILHGRNINITMNSDEVLIFIKRVFNVIEKLYER